MEKKPIRLKLPLKSVLLLFAVLSAIVLPLVWKASPPALDLNELSHVSLEVPETEPLSAPLSKLLERKEVLSFGPKEKQLERAIRKLDEGEWPPAPAALLGALESLEDPSIAGIRAALLAPGCLHRPEIGIIEEGPSHFSLHRGVQLLVLRAVLLSQQQRGGEGAAALNRLCDRLLYLEQRCRPALVPAVVLSSAIWRVRTAYGFMLARQDLVPWMRLAIWSRIRRMERRRSPMADAMRWEGKLTLSIVDAMDSDDDIPRRFPWYDKQETVRLGRHLARRNVWLAELSLASPEWARRLPEEDYLEQMREQPSWFTYFRYNGVGRALMAMATQDYRVRILRWHQERCMTAAHRASWVRELERRGRSIPSIATTPPPVDPFTRRRFRAAAPGDVRCAAPKRFRCELSGKTLVELPPTPR